MKNTKRFFMMLLLLTAIFTSSTQAFASDSSPYFFVGANGGLEIVAGASNSTGMEETTLMYGFTLRGIGDHFGLGLTGFTAKHGDDEDKPGIKESKISGNTFDFLFRFGKDDQNSVKYFMVSVGNVTEEHTSQYGSVKKNLTHDSEVWGIGVGTFSAIRSKVGIGGELRYLNLSDSDNANGLVQANILIGYIF